MISTTFVKLSREIISFIKKGNVLKANRFIYDFKTKSACALGAVCFNHDRSSYDFTQKFLGLGFSFYSGFDDCLCNGYLNVNGHDTAEYILGFKFAEMCRKRGWTI